MSYILVAFGEIPSHISEKIKSKFSSSIKIDSKDLVIAGNGLDQTFVYDDYGYGQIIICGISLIKCGNHYLEVRNNKLKELFDNPKIAENLQGHYTCLIKKDEKLTLFNDALGFREYYEFAGKNYSIISTEARYIAELVGGLKINKNWLATAYHLTVQLDKECFVEGITRYCGADLLELTYSNGNLIRQKSSFPLPKYTPQKTEDVISEIIKLSLPEIDGFEPVLSMSGGLDSRFLLSILKPEFSDLKAVSMGLRDHPDNIYAAEICKAIGVEHKLYDSMDFVSYPTVFDNFIDYVEGNKAHSPASEYLFMRLCDYIYKDGYIQIDAGWAEIGRLANFASIYYRAKYGIKSIDSSTLYKILKSSRPNIFNYDLEDELYQISLMKIEPIIKKYSLDISTDLWQRLDKFTIDYKISNNVSGKQSYNDNTSLCLSPFNQPIVNNGLIGLNPEIKRDGKLYKQLIDNNYPQLTKIPLVKNNHVIPFRFGTLASRLYMKFTRGKYRCNYSVKFFELFGDEIRDYLYSQKTFDSPYYDKVQIRKIIDIANIENPKTCEDIDRLITFEILRRSIELT